MDTYIERKRVDKKIFKLIKMDWWIERSKERKKKEKINKNMIKKKRSIKKTL